jgi:hypothetical protein
MQYKSRNSGYNCLTKGMSFGLMYSKCPASLSSTTIADIGHMRLSVAVLHSARVRPNIDTTTDRMSYPVHHIFSAHSFSLLYRNTMEKTMHKTCIHRRLRSLIQEETIKPTKERRQANRRKENNQHEPQITRNRQFIVHISPSFVVKQLCSHCSSSPFHRLSPIPACTHTDTIHNLHCNAFYLFEERLRRNHKLCRPRSYKIYIFCSCPSCMHIYIGYMLFLHRSAPGRSLSAG